MRRMDPRTKLGLGLLAICVVLITRRPSILVVEAGMLLAALLYMGLWGLWLRSLPLIGPTVAIVFAIGAVSFDIRVGLHLSIRLVNLLTMSFIFFRTIQPEEMGDALRKMGIPYEVSFILTTSMRYVPLIGQKIRNIMDAQRSRGIDLRPRLRNAPNMLALLMPLLVQSFILAEELAVAMEARGFGRKGRSMRREYRIAPWEYGLMIVSLGAVMLFAWWGRG